MKFKLLKRLQMTTEEVNNNLNILVDPTFTNVNRLFVLAYEVEVDDDDTLLIIDNHFLNFIYQILWLESIMLLLIN